MGRRCPLVHQGHIQGPSSAPQRFSISPRRDRTRTGLSDRRRSPLFIHAQAQHPARHRLVSCYQGQRATSLSQPISRSHRHGPSSHLNPEASNFGVMGHRDLVTLNSGRWSSNGARSVTAPTTPLGTAPPPIFSNSLGDCVSGATDRGQARDPSPRRSARSHRYSDRLRSHPPPSRAVPLVHLSLAAAWTEETEDQSGNPFCWESGSVQGESAVNGLCHQARGRSIPSVRSC
jgi:hypothetical protein